MNPPDQPTNPKPTPTPGSSADPIPPLPRPLSLDAGPGAVIEALLKHPGQLIERLQRPGAARLAVLLAGFALLALAGYGVLVGSFAGGRQWLAAPLKISLGVLASAIICLPSLFIFTCLTGADVTFRSLVGILSAIVALAALLLVGFAPVAWVFSQSTDSVAFIGALHVIFWLIGIGFGIRLLHPLMNHLRVRDRGHVKVWAVIFILVSLQMTTALRPIIGTSPEWLPTEKKFFLTYWTENLFAERSASSLAQ